MGLVLWIDQNTFATALLEKVFKKKGLPFYTQTSVDDFLYLVEDINPKLIVLDAQTFALNKEAFIKQYESKILSDLPFVLVDATPHMAFIGNVIGKINRPFDPFKIPETLKSFQNYN